MANIQERELVIANRNSQGGFRFDPEDLRSTMQRWEGLLGVIAGEDSKRRIDLLHLPETAQDLPPEAMRLLSAGMRDVLGYNQGIALPSPRGDKYVQTMWVRERAAGVLAPLAIGQGLVLPGFKIPGVAQVVGAHLPSDNPEARLKFAHSLVAYSRCERAEKSTVAVTDFNEAIPGATCITRTLHVLDPYLHALPGVDTMDHFGPVRVPILRMLPSANRIKAKLSAGIRASEMTRAEGLCYLKTHGFVDAAVAQRKESVPTVRSGMFRIAVDHTLAYGEGVEVRAFEIVPTGRDSSGNRTTDHDMTVTTIALS